MLHLILEFCVCYNTFGFVVKQKKSPQMIGVSDSTGNSSSVVTSDQEFFLPEIGVKPFIKRRKRPTGQIRQILERYKNLEEEMAQCDADDEGTVRRHYKDGNFVSLKKKK